MNFDKIQLSPYTEMDIEFYSEKDATGSKIGKDEKIKADDLYGMDKKNRTVQIPLTATSVKSVKIILKSAGQVQTDMNDGYTLKDITYVYGEVTGKGSTDVPLSSASIKWEAVNPNFSQPKELNIESTAGKGLGITKEYDDDTFSYEVPAFPLTGNAVITEKDKNGKIVAYYLVPTENQTGDKANTNDIKKIENKNEYVKAYKATAEEVSNYITTGVTQSDNGRTVKVDSEKNGITTLKGVLSIDGLGSDLLDATNREIYTSVQWNPIPNKAEESKSDAFLAIAGQKITVTGQLVDKNGNSVSTSGKTIKFYKDGKEIMSDEKVTVVKAPAATDTNGKSTIVLSAAQATAFPNVTASCTDSQYDVKLTIKDSSVSDKADLYWVNADLQFLSKVGEAESKDAPKNTTSNNTITVDVEDPTVGTPWEYGVKTVAGKIDADTANGKLAGYTIDITGLKIFTESSDENKGKYTAIEGENGKVAANSEIANDDKISAKINGDSITDSVTFIATKDGKSLPPFVCVGEGTPNMNAKINMNVKWQPKGVSIAMITPMGTTMKDGKVKLYVRLTDSTGKNPLASKDVKFISGNSGDTLAASDTGLAATAGESVTIQTNKQGVAEVWVKARTIVKDNESSIITATVPSMEQTTSTTINWLNDDKTEALGIVKAAKTDDKQVTVTFNNEMNGDTVKAGNFKLTGKNAADKDVQYEVTSAKASGNSVILTLSETLPAGKYTVAINNDYAEGGIVYTPADVVGQTVTEQDKVDFYSTKNATFSLELSADGTGFEINNVSSPVDVIKADDTTPVKGNEATKDFTITVNGKITAQGTPFVKYDSNKKIFTFELSDLNTAAGDAYDGKLKVGTVVKVYYMGNVEGYTISNSDIVGLAINDIITNNTSVTAGSPLADLTGKSLSDNSYGCTVKVVAYDDVNSLYTTTDETDKNYASLDTIIADSDDRLTGVALSELTTVNTAPTNGKFVKLEVTFYDNTDVSKGKAIATKYLKLTSDGTKYILSK